MSRLKDRIASMVFAFDDADRQDAVRALVRDVGALERELEQAKEDRARAAMDARNPLLARLAELEAENKALRDRVAEMDTEAKAARIAIRKAYDSASRAADMRAAGDALARHVAEDTRGQASRQLVQAWEEASR